MTPSDQRITEHLAEKVCGFPPDNWWAYHGHCMVDGRPFHPLTDPRDTSIVMEAWNKQQQGLIVETWGEGEPANASAWKESMDVAAGRASAPIWTRAVCEAIYQASGGEEGE